ncbi:MAG: MBL fold metallo-hydrolase [Alphaproteobacteria bacterium]
MKITILGSGSAYGTPNVFNDWGQIKNKQNKKNTRTRASTYIEIDNTKILVDMTPEFREQINNNNINDIDAIFLTHGHYDHIASVPELWRAAHILQKKINIFCFKDTYTEIKTCFPYLFKANIEKGSDAIIWNVLEENESFIFNNIEWQTFQVKHGRLTTTAFKHKNFAIVMDVEQISIENKEKIKNLDLLILECCNGLEKIANGHNDFIQTKNWLKEIKPKRTILTHISVKVDHDELESQVPNNVELAYDGMTVYL